MPLLTLLIIVCLLGFIVVRRDTLLARFLLFGVVVRPTELVADAWLGRLYAHTRLFGRRRPNDLAIAIVDAAGGEVVAVQFGYVRLRLWERFGTTGLLMIGLLGAINIPFYEEMARRIHWWQYDDCRMISYTPVHHSRRVRYCNCLRVFGWNSAIRFLARRHCCRHSRRRIHFCLLCGCVSDYKSVHWLGR